MEPLGSVLVKAQYYRLLAMTVFSFIAMYILMYAMMNSSVNVLNNLNQAYMAGLMAAPMVLIELVLMRGMYPDMRVNVVIDGVRAAGLALVARPPLT